MVEIPPQLVDSTVVVTGGAGFIGGHLVDALVDAAEVRVLDHLSSGSADRIPAGADLVRGDVCEEASVAAVLDGADVVFHQAGLVSVPASVDAPVRFHEVNVDGTLGVLEGARAADTRVVLASSAAIYGQPQEVPIPESHPKRPASPYALDKLALDHYGRLYADLYGLETVVLRYFNVYGPGQSDAYAGVVSAFRDQAADGGPLTVHGDGTQTRDFVHVQDVVRANLAAAATDATGRAYNVGTGTAHSVTDLAHLVRELAAESPEIRHTSGREGDVEESTADVVRARDELGFDATVPLRTGLADLLGAGDAEGAQGEASPGSPP